MPMWTDAMGRMQKRMEDTRRRVGSAYPHWADPETGAWTTTANGDSRNAVDATPGVRAPELLDPQSMGLSELKR